MSRYISLTLLSLLFIAYSCNRYNDIDEPGADEIKKYFRKEMIDQINDINRYYSEDCILFNILTDNHISANSVNIEANKQTIDNLSYINKQFKFDGLIHLGDIVQQTLYTEERKSDNDIYSIINEYLNNLKNCSERVFVINGNHDGKEANYFEKDKWINITSNLCISELMYNDTQYYYFDIPNKKVRCIFLSTPDNDKAGNIIYGYTDKALEWLSSTALNVNDSTDIFIFGHIPPFTSSYISEKKLKNRAAFEGICNAFNNHSLFTDDNVAVDFSANQNSRIRAYISGHEHVDLIAYPGYKYNGKRATFNGSESHTYENNLTFPVIVIGHNYFNSNTPYADHVGIGGITYERKHNSSSQDLWDTMIYNTKTKELKLIRFGAGENRFVSLN